MQRGRGLPLPRYLLNMYFPKPAPLHLPRVILVLTLLGIYLSTLAPGVTWANNGSDGGDLISAAYTGGIPHPTGYPTYLIIARFFQWMPVGSLAYRTNLLSALATTLTALLAYELVAQTLRHRGVTGASFAALIAGFAFGVSPLAWSQAVITEVYALQSLLIALILLLFIHPPKLDRQGLDRLRGLFMGLAVGSHLTTALLFPLLFFPGSWDIADTPEPRQPDTKRPASSLIRKLVWLAFGLSIYLTLPLRALTNPPVNWGKPVTLERFWWLVSGELYRSYYLQFQLEGIGERTQAWASLLLDQFGLIGVLLAVAGLVIAFKPSRLYFYTIWIGAAFSIFSILYSTADSYVYLIPVSLSFAVWLGLGVGLILEKAPPDARVVQWGMGLLVLSCFAIRAFGYAGEVDASRDLRAERFGRQVMSEVPKDALVFVKGDEAVFTVWYFHFALGERPDLAVIAEELLHFDWYQETLRDSYPGLAVPGPFPWAQNIADANPAHPVCRVQYADRAEIECGSR